MKTTMTTPRPGAAVRQDGSAWWRHPMMWLVVGGPAAVVAACLVTTVIAVRGADRPLSAPLATPTAPAGPVSAAPALQMRNHAATQVLPAAARRTAP